MDHRLDLVDLHKNPEYADCTLVAANGDKFEVHRVVLAQHPSLKALIDGAPPREQGLRVLMDETSEVVKLMVEWLYGVPWLTETQMTAKGKSDEMTHAMGVADAAGKVCCPANQFDMRTDVIFISTGL